MMRNRIAILVVLLCVVLSGCTVQKIQPSADTLEVHMLDVGDADCLLVRQSDACMLIDAGDPADADRIVSYLHTQGVRRIDYLVLTHPHADHIGSMTRIVQAFEIGEYLYGALSEELEVETRGVLQYRLETALKEAGVLCTEVGNGAERRLGNATLTVYPQPSGLADINEYSVVSRVTFGGEALLCMGDCGEARETALLGSGADIAASLIKLGHHGAYTETQRRFLKRVGAKAALIPCGADDAHPSDETRQILAELNIDAYCSDECGTVVATTRGSGWTIQTEIKM